MEMDEKEVYTYVECSELTGLLETLESENIDYMPCGICGNDVPFRGANDDELASGEEAFLPQQCICEECTTKAINMYIEFKKEEAKEYIERIELLKSIK